MLEILRCSTSNDKLGMFNDIDADRETWIVSDLMSKWHLQRELIQRRGVLEQTAVLRATELWQRFAFQLFPRTHILSHELAQTLFWNWIEPMNLPWARSPQAVPVVLKQMQMWMSVFSDPNFEDLMGQWFRDNPESYVRWGHWFELCAEIWKRCQRENLLMVSWLPAMLLSQDLTKITWTKPLTFDLGPQISQVEGQLIQELAKIFTVRVLYPEAPWLGLMRNTLRPYELLLGQNENYSTDWRPDVSEAVSFGRFSTQLAEVKDTVARVRAWLEAGIRPHQIAVVAPDIEEYWPALQMYFEQEGIPAAKPVAAKIGGFLEMAKWASSLRTAMSKVSSGDLEVHLFAQSERPKLRFDEFRVLFSNVYDASDLSRAKNLFEGQALPSAPVPATDFIAWALGFWESSAETLRLMSLLQIFGQEVPAQLSLKPGEWLSYLEGLLARRECTLRPADDQGIWCVSLSSAEWLPVTHGVFLNLNEGALRTVDHSPVSDSEGQRVFTDTGYAVGTNDRQELEFEFLWFLKREWQELRLCFSSTDFQGSVLTPSRLWMWAGFVSKQLKREAEAPRPTRWDELQSLPVEKLTEVRGFEKTREESMLLAFRRDFDGSVNTWGRTTLERLSASALERYWACPFMFAAERKLKLSDDPQLDLDVDRRTRGSLLHGLAECLCTEPIRYDWSDQELMQLVDQVREKEQLLIGDERLWPAVRSQHVRLGKQFLAFEKVWRERFPETKTIGREIAFEADWGGLKMAGRIDRVDRDSQGRYAVIDYKAGAGGTTNWKTWIKNQRIQLALYAFLIENAMTGLPKASVVAANYYVIKDNDRRKGFHLKDETSELYSSSDRHMNFITEDDKAALFEMLQEMIGQTIEDLGEGQLNPKPKDFKTCNDCSWRTLCRAPHLN
jgi:RecB family exonuclease